MPRVTGPVDGGERRERVVKKQAVTDNKRKFNANAASKQLILSTD